LSFISNTAATAVLAATITATPKLHLCTGAVPARGDVDTVGDLTVLAVSGYSPATMSFGAAAAGTGSNLGYMVRSIDTEISIGAMAETTAQITHLALADGTSSGDDVFAIWNISAQNAVVAAGGYFIAPVGSLVLRS
jgi:hypothetical protein